MSIQFIALHNFAIELFDWWFFVGKQRVKPRWEKRWYHAQTKQLTQRIACRRRSDIVWIQESAIHCCLPWIGNFDNLTNLKGIIRALPFFVTIIMFDSVSREYHCAVLFIILKFSCVFRYHYLLSNDDKFWNACLNNRAKRNKCRLLQALYHDQSERSLNFLYFDFKISWYFKM